MPRWPDGYVSRVKQTCPDCGGRKDFYAEKCRKCKAYGKPLLGVKGESHPTWKGGYRIDRDGYIMTYCPDHPWPRASGYVREHVRVMELHIGRRIAVDEVIHHLDGDRQHNELSNLKLMIAADHSSLHARENAPKRKRDSNGRFAGKEVQYAGE